MTSRREYIAGIGCASSFLFAGCSETEPEDVVDDWQEERYRGGADPIELEETTDERPDERKCIEVAQNEIMSILGQQVGSTSNIGIGWRSDDGDRYLLVSRRLLLSRDGDVRSRPGIEFEEVHKATPRTASVLLHHDDSSFSCEPPVYVQDQMIQED